MYTCNLFLLILFVTFELLSIVQKSNAGILIYTTVVRRVKKDDQDAALIREKNLCYQRLYNATISGNTTTSKTLTCPIRWDGIVCWDETPAGLLVEKTCPDYVDKFNIVGKLSKRCTEAGTWYIKPNKTREWTNTTECRPEVDQFAMTQIKIIFKIGIIGYTISLVSLCIAIFILRFFRRLHCDRNTIHLNLFVALLLRCIIYFPGIYFTSGEEMSKWACKSLQFLRIYLIQTVYTWVFVEALYLHNAIFNALSGYQVSVYVYVSLGWILPFIITGVWATLRLIFDNTFCWDERQDPLNVDHWVVVIYPLILTLCNVAFFINLIRALFLKVTTQPVQDRSKYKKLAKAIMILMVAFGLYQLAFTPIDVILVSDKDFTSPEAELGKLYCEHFISSFQGFLVSLLFCFVNGEVLAEIRRRFCPRSAALDDTYENYRLTPANTNQNNGSQQVSQQKKAHSNGESTPPECVRL